jgi:hypothetical protein
VNNIGQAQNTLRDYIARPINPGSRRKITPQEALLNASNALTDDDTIGSSRTIQTGPRFSPRVATMSPLTLTTLPAASMNG